MRRSNRKHYNVYAWDWRNQHQELFNVVARTPTLAEAQAYLNAHCAEYDNWCITDPDWKSVDYLITQPTSVDYNSDAARRTQDEWARKYERGRTAGRRIQNANTPGPTEVRPGVNGVDEGPPTEVR